MQSGTSGKHDFAGKGEMPGPWRLSHGRPLLRSLPAWATENGHCEEVVLSTRARLARNIEGAPFPVRATDAQLKSVSDVVLRAAGLPQKGVGGMRPLNIDQLDQRDRAALVDSHLISVALAVAGTHRWALVDDRRTISVMVNEEDHLRIQAIVPGLAPERAWRIADEIDDWFSGRLNYAAHAEYGYLTSSLGNCGTGLRLSVMAHLPALALSGRLNASLQAAQTLGVSVRGFLGEDSSDAGAVFQISNAVSIGLTEAQIVSRLSAVVTYLVTEEEAARQILSENAMDRIEALVEKAERKLGQANRLTDIEAMDLLSVLRLGECAGLNTGVSATIFAELLATMRLGAQHVAGQRAQYTFYEENRRPSLVRNKIRQGMQERLTATESGAERRTPRAC